MSVRRSIVAALGVFSIPLFLTGERALLQEVSGAQTITAAPKVSDDMNTTVFQTPAGKISVNIPEDIAAGDTITGTVIAEPAPGQTPDETAQNQDELNGYVIEAKNAEEAPPEEKPVTAVNPSQPSETPPEQAQPSESKAKKHPKPKKDPLCDPLQKLMTMVLPPPGTPIEFHLHKKPKHETGPSQVASHYSAPLVDPPQSSGSAPAKNPSSHYSAPLVDKPQPASSSPSASAPSGHYSAPLVDPAAALSQDAPAIHSSPSLASRPIFVPASPPASSLPKGSVKLPQVGQLGHPISIKASGCSGYPSGNSVMVGNQKCEPLAMGPRSTIVKSPSRIVGPSTITYKQGGKVAQAPFHNLAVKLSCPNPTLHKGETTTLTVTVSGLKGLTHPVKLTITNRTPNVVDLDGGNEQVITINPTGSDSQTVP